MNNKYITWLLAHWRIVAPAVASVSALAVNLAKPGGLSWLAANWEAVSAGVVALGTWGVHAYRHVRDGEEVTDTAPPAVLSGLVTTVDSNSVLPVENPANG